MRIRRDLRHVCLVVEHCAAPAVDPELGTLVLALEDKRFFHHPGVDVIALARAIWRFVSLRPNGGASTIDMQLVRTITGRRQRTLSRKLAEVIVAVLVRRRFGSRAILATYLCVAYTGTSLTGLQAAAVRVFGRPVLACSRKEKAELAAMLLHPVPKRPTSQWWNSLRRRGSLAQLHAVHLNSAVSGGWPLQPEARTIAAVSPLLGVHC